MNDDFLLTEMAHGSMIYCIKFTQRIKMLLIVLICCSDKLNDAIIYNRNVSIKNVTSKYSCKYYHFRIYQIKSWISLPEIPEVARYQLIRRFSKTFIKLIYLILFYWQRFTIQFLLCVCTCSINLIDKKKHL